MKSYFSSDFHLSHTNILKYDNRPFSSIEKMNDTIMKNCMQLFKSNDEFYYLGDFCLEKKKSAESFLEILTSSGVKMFFIKGNHDSKDIVKLYEKYGTYLGEQKAVKVNGQTIILNHYRMDVWDKSHHGSWHLHGHSHHSLAPRQNARCIDVGINGKEYNYTPLEFERIAKYMALKTWEPIDHHGRDTE